MKPWILVDESRSPDNTLLALYRRGEEFSIRAGGEVLMGSRCQGSEIALAGLAIDASRARQAPRVLVGGLGCGYTLRAALDRLPPSAAVAVSELVPAVVSWNRGPLAHLAGNPLSDSRVTLVEGDIITLLRDEASSFDIILLDVDNGPEGFTQESNGWLYSGQGLSHISRVLRPEGIVAIWSAGEDRGFTARLTGTGFDATCHRVRSREGGKGARHVIWIGKKPAVRAK